MTISGPTYLLGLRQKRSQPFATSFFSAFDNAEAVLSLSALCAQYCFSLFFCGILKGYTFS